MQSISPMKRWFIFLWVLFLVPRHLLAWTDGELLIWMDADRGQALDLIARKFEKEIGVNTTIETPDKITDNFPLVAQVGKGPDIVIWAHDKVGEWADAGLIAPVEFSDDFAQKLYYRPSDFTVVDRLTEIATKRGVTNAQVALGWILGKPGVSSPIIGASKMTHLDQAIDALQIQLDESEIEALEEPYEPHPVLGF